jgi:hypothetical protein
MSSGFVPLKDRRRLEAFVEDFRRSPYAAVDHGQPLAVVPSPIDEEAVRDHENQVFGNFSEYLDYLHEWLIYRTAARLSRFEDWLRTRGAKGPPKYYGEPC